MAHRGAIALFVVLMTSASLSMIHAADPELTSDFFTPPGVTASGDFFTSKLLEKVVPNAESPFATVTPANVGGFVALTGLGVSSALLQFPPGTVNRPHTHPRGTELLFVLTGTLYVGLVDSNNTLFTQTLKQGDLFVFPRGLVHFQINLDEKVEVVAYGSFSSSSPGTIVLPINLFGSGISVDVLAKSFQVSVDIIKKLVEANPKPQ